MTGNVGRLHPDVAGVTAAAREALAAVHRHLDLCKLAARTVRAYKRQACAYVTWLAASSDAHGDAFTDLVGAEGAVTAWKRHMLAARASASAVNEALAAVTLMYAQAGLRILTLDDVLQEDGQVAIRLGDPPVPVPEPFTSLLLRHMDQRLNLTTATNAGARWLFPGRRGGQPMTPDTIERRLRLARIPTRGARSAALRQLVLQAPAPVIATMLGYSHEGTAQVAAEVGSPWSRYAPVGPDRPRPGKGDS
jgi:hypothetical protein